MFAVECCILHSTFCILNLAAFCFLLSQFQFWFWLDTGTHESLLDAANFVEALYKRQGLVVCCPEEIAFRKGWISARQLKQLAQQLGKSAYSEYLDYVGAAAH